MKKIGIVGGGQLGKMMILDGKRLDHYFVILDPTEHCPAHSIADEHIVADFDNVEAILEMASRVDVVTWRAKEKRCIRPVIRCRIFKISSSRSCG